MRRVAAAVATLAALMAAVATTAIHAQMIAVARVNGVDIPHERLERGFEEELRNRGMNLLQIRNPERLKEMKRSVLDNLIEQELFWQAAQHSGVVVTATEVEEAFQATKGAFRSADAFEQRIRLEGFTPGTYRDLVRKQVYARKYAQQVAAAAPAVTDEEIHRFYVDNPGNFRRPEQARVRHIVVNVPPGAGEEVRAARRELAESIAARAQAGEDFAALARQYSEAPTRQWGGEMDPFARGEAPAPIEAAAFALSPGEVSGVIVSGDSFQVVKLESRSDAVLVTEDAARSAILGHLSAAHARQAIAAEAQRLRASQDVQVLLPL
jgi:parvulin-like peptidyl-prolyl isomerase